MLSNGNEIAQVALKRRATPDAGGANCLDQQLHSIAARCQGVRIAAGYYGSFGEGGFVARFEYRPEAAECVVDMAARRAHHRLSARDADPRSRFVAAPE